MRPRPTLGYLSAAPTVSTRMEAASAGPRAHILGVISGFKQQGWDVLPFIMGDRISGAAPSTPISRRFAGFVAGGGVQKALERHPLFRPPADLARTALGYRNARWAYRELGAKVDWVYERLATLQTLGHPFARAGVPWILETQGLFFYETKVERPNVALYDLARRMEVRAYRACDVLVCVTPVLKELLVEQCEIPAEKILVVPNAVELERFDLALNCRARYFGELTLCFVGKLIRWQALDFLIEVLGELRREEGVKLALVVVGDGSEMEPLKALARNAGIAEHVRFLGAVSGAEVARHLSMCDIGYSGPKVMEIGAMYHSPIKLYEYMAMAKPIIAAAFADSRALIEGRDTGFLFRSGDKESLKRALRSAHAAHRSGTLADMGRTARRLIEREHTWTARMAAAIPEIEGILETRQGTRGCSMATASRP